MKQRQLQRQTAIMDNNSSVYQHEKGAKTTESAKERKKQKDNRTQRQQNWELMEDSAIPVCCYLRFRDGLRTAGGRG